MKRLAATLTRLNGQWIIWADAEHADEAAAVLRKGQPPAGAGVGE